MTTGMQPCRTASSARPLQPSPAGQQGSRAAGGRRVGAEGGAADPPGGGAAACGGATGAEGRGQGPAQRGQRPKGGGAGMPRQAQPVSGPAETRAPPAPTARPPQPTRHDQAEDGAGQQLAVVAGRVVVAPYPHGVVAPPVPLARQLVDLLPDAAAVHRLPAGRRGGEGGGRQVEEGRSPGLGHGGAGQGRAGQAAVNAERLPQPAQARDQAGLPAAPTCAAPCLPGRRPGCPSRAACSPGRART
jgi:hypothetical protein